MIPAIRPGEMITVRRAGMNEASIGDVVLCKREDRFFVHRVVRRSRQAIVTRGDAVCTEDPPVGPNEFLGIAACAPRTWRCRAAAMIFRRSTLAARLYMRIAPA